MTNRKRKNMVNEFVDFAKRCDFDKNNSRFQVVQVLMAIYQDRPSIVMKRIIDDILDGNWGTYYKLLPDVNWDSYSVDELELTVRTHNCLVIRAGVKTIGEARGLTFEQVKNMKNFGRKSWQELQNKLWGV
jgi:DNA-directed RNA polymerase alpha subunit